MAVTFKVSFNRYYNLKVMNILPDGITISNQIMIVFIICAANVNHSELYTNGTKKY